VDTHKPEFWQKGFDEIGTLLSKLISLIAE